MEEKYQQLEHREHIYKIPDTYIGSIEPHNQELFVFNHDTEKMECKPITYVPGFFKIFDEVLVNATDHRQRDPTVKNIKITFEKGKTPISILNDGNGIDIILHSTKQIYIPELLFAHLLTSTNYNQNEKRTTGGRNGYGVKVTGIFSDYLIIETVDATRSLKYIQKLSENNKVIEPPKISKFSGKPYTKITFFPDYKKFGLENGITDEIFQLLERRVYDTAAITPSDLSVWLNGSKLKIKSWEKYIPLWIPLESEIVGTTKQKGIFFTNPNDRWKIGLILSPNREFLQVSFVNSIWTMKGGRHVDYIMNQIIDKIKSLLSKNSKTKNKLIKPNQIRENVWIFIDCIIENPAFTSQTKEELSSKISQFGSVCEINENFIEKFLNYKSTIDGDSLIERIIEKDKQILDKQLKKTDGSKKNIIRGIPKLEDAFLAGTKQSTKCTLILTEGDSAKSSVISGLSVLGPEFRNKFGIFPLRGKFLNVRDISADKVTQNEEIKNLKMILGLQQGRIYTEENIKELRYGSISITTDQDSDGSHIKGLILNFLHFYWPSLLKINGFLKAYITPIVKGFNGSQVKCFYTINDYEKFKSTTDHKWTYKYYKGLGTSTAKEFKEYFSNISDITVRYEWDTDEPLIMAFSKNTANLRKEWLQTYNPEETIEYITKKEKIVSLSTFIHKDLKHFSNYDNYRSIPNVIDGLKPSQRKVLYGLQLKLGNKYSAEIKVAQLASFVSEQTHYHHGEVSLEQTIVGMAQDFCGKNNLPILRSIGQFGSILHGGKDHAQSRYIFTGIFKYTGIIFSDRDTPLLHHLKDEDKKIEPELYYPIIPMILVNGTEGIGTGYSSSIPCFNVDEIIHSIIEKNRGIPFKKLWIPCYKGFKGSITETEESPTKFLVRGKYKYILEENFLIIYELPIGLWTQTYKEFLENLILQGVVLQYVDKSTDIDTHFEVKLSKPLEDIEKHFKLSNKISLNNMWIYDENRKIHKFESIIEILEYFYEKRLKKYGERKEHILREYNNRLELLTEKLKFISLVLENPHIVFKKTKEQIRQKLDQHGLYRLDILLSMPVSQWSEEKIDELHAEINKVQSNIQILQQKTAESIWNDDLEELVKSLN